MDINQRLAAIRSAALAWYPFDTDSEKLEISGIDDIWNGLQSGQYDYIVCDRRLESERDPASWLKNVCGLLKPDGKMLILMNNRLGVKYFCGDCDPYSKEVLSCLIKRDTEPQKGRLFSKAEIIDILNDAGFNKYKFYSVLSDLENPSHIIAHDYKPNEDIANRLYPTYYSPETVFIEEEQLYQDLIENGLFHSMANGFLIEASKDIDVSFADALQVTSTLDRDSENAFFTIIHNDGTVTKENAYSEGIERFKYMQVYADDLKQHKINVVEIKNTSKGISMPYIDAPTGQLALKQALLGEGKEAFFEMTDQFRDCILQASEIVEEDEKLGAIAKYGYIDMVPLNSFYINENYVFFDQEFRVERYPINAIISRMIATFFFGNENLKSIVSEDEVYERYGILNRKDLYRRMEWDFLSPLRNEEALAEYHCKIRRNNELTSKNRDRMQFSADRYIQVFSEVFEGYDTKDVYVFGAGRFSERFMDWYGAVISVKGIVDNNHEKWGKKFCGVVISAPEVLKDIPKDSYKVIICIKNYLPVIRQLKELDVDCFSVYDGRTVLHRDFIIFNDKTDDSGSKKPYRKGYVAGAFDMFHIGHLNLLRRAKDYCDYLVVGIMSDEKMYDLKGKNPIIPCDERMQVVAGCRYVNEVVELPIDKASISEAYNMVHFDCMFSGDDHIQDEAWLLEQRRLRERGSDIVFFPYTKETSSTAIRKKIDSGVYQQ